MKKIVKIWYNFAQYNDGKEAGETYESHAVGVNGVTEIKEHIPADVYGLSYLIKFRAISHLSAFGKSDSPFVYGYLMYDVDGFPRICEVNSIGTITSRKCKKGTEGQFTGLKDRNGVDIYEGDILLSSVKIKYVVEWDNIGACFKSATGLYRLNPTGYIFSEIIGNIHQNKDLLTPH